MENEYRINVEPSNPSVQAAVPPLVPPGQKRASGNVLVGGWFSFSDGHATAGDLLALQVACQWLIKAGFSYDVAFDPPFNEGVDWRIVDPDTYSHVVFVCGPFERKQLEADFLSRFHGCRLIGLNLSMRVPVEKWNPFDLLFERDSSAAVRPDMVFLSAEPQVPVVGICLVEPYADALDHLANEAIGRLVQSNKMVTVNIDTRLDRNTTNLRTPAEVESLIARMDLLVTTRLHGAVMALKNGVPVVSIDPEAGGAKIVAQMQKIGWPVVFSADALTEEGMQTGFEYCLTPEARIKARDCRDYAVDTIGQTAEEFIREMIRPEISERNYKTRLADPEAKNWLALCREKESEERMAIRQRQRKTRWKYNIQKRVRGIMREAVRWTLPAPVADWIRKIFSARPDE